MGLQAGVTFVMHLHMLQACPDSTLGFRLSASNFYTPTFIS